MLLFIRYAFDFGFMNQILSKIGYQLFYPHDVGF